MGVLCATRQPDLSRGIVQPTRAMTLGRGKLICVKRFTLGSCPMRQNTPDPHRARECQLRPLPDPLRKILQADRGSRYQYLSRNDRPP